jgi:P4 family phage/plasmid primase-like protien
MSSVSGVSDDLLSYDEVVAVLEENDGSPQALLKHRGAGPTIAAWKDDPFEHDFQYEDLMEEIKFNRVDMPIADWREYVEKAVDRFRNGDSDELAEDDEPPLDELSATQFHDEFNWNQMQDRAMANKCHQWVKENEDIIFTNDRVLVYDDGIWGEDEGKIARILQNLLNDHYGNNVKKEFLDGYIRAHEEYRVEWREMGIRSTKVAVKNGLLDLKEGEIVRDLEPDDYAIMRLPVTWEGPDAESPRWDDFVSKSVEPESQKMVQEYAGSCLHTNEYPFKKALMLLGGGDNGKGVFENVITAMLGHDNVSHDDLTDMAGGQFGLQRLRHKTANINSDINGGKIEETSMFKKLTGGDRVRVEPKYETAFEMENPAKMIFAANSVPKVDNAERAFYRRWLFVEFPNRFTFDEDDQYMDAIRGLDDQIIESELSGVLAWAVEGYQRLQENQKFTGEKNADEIRRNWNDYQDTTATFVRNFISHGDPQVDDELDHPMRVDTLYRYYRKYIRTTPTAAKSKHRLNNYITADHQYPDAETKSNRAAATDDDTSDVVRVWDGIYIPKDAREKISERYKDALTTDE